MNFQGIILLAKHLQSVFGVILKISWLMMFVAKHYKMTLSERKPD